MTTQAAINAVSTATRASSIALILFASSSFAETYTWRHDTLQWKLLGSIPAPRSGEKLDFTILNKTDSVWKDYLFRFINPHGSAGLSNLLDVRGFATNLLPMTQKGEAKQAYGTGPEQKLDLSFTVVKYNDAQSVHNNRELKGFFTPDHRASIDVWGIPKLTGDFDVPPFGVPEIDPASCGSVVAFVIGALGFVERKSRRRWTSAATFRT